MKTQRVHLSLCIVIMVITTMWNPSAIGQAKFQSLASGAWTAAPTWTLVNGSDADGIPDADDTVVVTSAKIVTVAATDVNCAFLTIDAGGELRLTGIGNALVNAAPGSATINGTLTLASTGSLQDSGVGTRTLIVGNGGKVTISGNAATPSFDVYALDPASTFEYTFAGAQTIKSGIVFGNLTTGGSGKKTVGPPRPSDTTFTSKGKLTVGSGTILDVSTYILHIYFEGDVEIYGTLDASVGITVLTMTGAQWLNYGTFLPSTTPLFGYQPSVTFVNTSIGGSPVAQTFYDLIVNGMMTALNGFTVTRHVTINPGGTFNAGTGLTHTVAGNWTNNGTLNAATSTVTFNGTSLQDIGASTFNNVIVNNAAGVRLLGNVSIASGGTLTLTSGSVTTGANTLAILSTSLSALTLGTNSITGTVSRGIAPGSTGTYAFFSANAYVIPGGTNNPTSITATVFPNTNPPNLLAPADTSTIVKRYYTISAAGNGPGFNYLLRLPYAQSEVRGLESQYTLWKSNGGGWSNMGRAGSPDTVNNFAEQNSLTSFSNWTLAENTSPLPIQLGSFSAGLEVNTMNVKLSWTTVSEINNYGFYIQRSSSPDAGYVDLPESFVHGAGTSLSHRHYQWIDHNVPPGTWSYRLKQVDLDGSIQMSDPAGVAVGTGITGVSNDRVPLKFDLGQNYPNPFNPSTKINFSVENAGFASLKVYDLLGKEIATLFEGSATPGREYTAAFEAGALSNGAYFYRLTSGEKSSLRKMVLLK